MKTFFAKKLVRRTVVMAEAAALCLVSSASMAAIVDSGVVNLAVPLTLDGIYVNFVTGVSATVAPFPAGWDFDPYSNGGNLVFFTSTTSTNINQVVATSTTGPVADLAPGTVVGPASIYGNAGNRTTVGTTFASVTGRHYVGVRFTRESDTSVHFGYVEMSTTAGTGFPATIVRYVYDDTPNTAITIPADIAADLSITKTDSATSVNSGTDSIYTIVASNAGPSAVTGATVTDTLPSNCNGAMWTCVGAGGGTCATSGTGNINDTTVNLPVGGSVTYSLMCSVTADSDTLANTATISSSTTDPSSANNSATDTNLVIRPDALYSDGFE